MILMACFSFALDCLFVRKYSGRLGVVNKGFTLKTLNYTINSALFTSIACHFTKIDEMGEYYFIDNNSVLIFYMIQPSKMQKIRKNFFVADKLSKQAGI